MSKTLQTELVTDVTIKVKHIDYTRLLISNQKEHVIIIIFQYMVYLVCQDRCITGTYHNQSMLGLNSHTK
jgi:hypothetical protein